MSGVSKRIHTGAQVLNPGHGHYRRFTPTSTQEGIFINHDKLRKPLTKNAVYLKIVLRFFLFCFFLPQSYVQHVWHKSNPRQTHSAILAAAGINQLI